MCLTDEDQDDVGEASGARCPLEDNLCRVCNNRCNKEHLNYGGKVCNKCRAFFRRVYQKDSVPDYKCVQDPKDRCDMRLASKRIKCRKCRLDLCHKAGMQREKVMDEHRKKARFRKVLAKQIGVDHRDNEEFDSENLKDVKLTFKRKSRAPRRQSSNLEIESERKSSPASSASSSSGDEVNETTVSKPIDLIGTWSSFFDATRTRDRRLTEKEKLRSYGLLKKKDLMLLKNLQSSWDQAMRKTPFLDSRVIRRFVAFHTELMDDSSSEDEADVMLVQKAGYLHPDWLTPDLLAKYFYWIHTVVTNFAMEQSEVLELEGAQMSEVIGNATSHFVSYILARYLSSTSGPHQLMWGLLGQRPGRDYLRRRNLKSCYHRAPEVILRMAPTTPYLTALEPFKALRLPLWCTPFVLSQCLQVPLTEQPPHLRALLTIFREASEEAFPGTMDEFCADIQRLADGAPTLLNPDLLQRAALSKRRRNTS